MKKEQAIHCERCHERLSVERRVWLELSMATGQYAQPGTVPAGESQGLFSFGSACARTVLAAGGKNARIRRPAR